MSGQYGRRDEACPVSTGGGGGGRLVRASASAPPRTSASTQCSAPAVAARCSACSPVPCTPRDAACPISTG